MIVATSIISSATTYYFFKGIGWGLPSETPPPEKVSEGAESPKVTLPQVLYNLAGSIRKMEQDSFLLEASIPILNGNNQLTQKTEIRKVFVTPITRFSSLNFITQGNKKIPQETKITFQDLKIGSYVEVISNQDIFQKPEFEATQIRILPKSF